MKGVGLLLAAPAALALGLGGCASPSQLAPVSSIQSLQFGPVAQHRGSWIDPAAKSGDLLYVSGGGESNSYVDIFSYPQGKAVGVLSDGIAYPSGLCTDKAGDVFVTNLDGPRDIVEYAHGGTSPIETLNDPQEFPIGCSIDPTTGNLAVANELGTYGSGSVSIYANASGSPEGPYSDSSFYEVWFCGYDNEGNLFIDGVDSNDNFQFAELAAGSTEFTNITLNQKFRWPGGIQWDGTYLAVGDREGGVIYQTTGAGGEIVSSTKLTGAGIVSQYYIDGKTVIAPNNGATMFWKYPKGGKPYKTISGTTQPFGSVVSKGKAKK